MFIANVDHDQDFNKAYLHLRYKGWGEGGAFHGLQVSRKLMSNCPEKFLKSVAQAFQPVRISEAGETPALRFFLIYSLAVDL
jgi:hypothetical protein